MTTSHDSSPGAPPELRHLALLRELSARGTLNAVANATHRTPSAISQQLRTAERDLGVRLVEPFARGLRLTPEGQLLADGADEVLGAVAALRARLDEHLRTPSGRVSIGTLPSAGEILLPALVARLRGSDITLDFDDFDLAEQDYARRTLDFDIVISHSLAGAVPAGAKSLAHRALLREPVDVALPAEHPLAARIELTPHDLRGTEWIGVPENYPFDTILQRVEAALDESLHRVVRLRDNRLVEALVAAGTGLALLPRYSTRPHAGTVLLPLRNVETRRYIVALSRHDQMNRLAVREVVTHLAAIGADLESRGSQALLMG